MTRRNRIILIVAGLLLIVAVIFIAIWTRPSENGEKKTQQPTNQAQNVNAGVTTPEKEIQIRQATPEELARSELQNLSTNFAERYGSYSNDGNFENIVDLYPFMTISMKDWAEETVEELRAGVQRETYEGTTTRATNVQFTSLNLDLGIAETLVKTQRTEEKANEKGEIESKTLYEDLRLEFLKSGKEWKIDAAYWIQ